MNALLESKRQAVLDLARSYGITRVSVFGSMAREDATGASDRRVDLVTEQALHPSIREKILREAVRL